MKSLPVIGLYVRLFDILTPHERKRFWQVFGLMVVRGFVELFGIISILPFLVLAGEPSIIHNTKALSFIYWLFGFSSDYAFIFATGIVVFIVILSTLAYQAFMQYVTARFVTMRNYTLAMRLLGSYLSQPYTWFLDRHSSDITKSVLGEVAQVVSKTIMPVLRLMASTIVLICIVGMLILVDPYIAAVAGGVVGGLFLVMVLGTWRILSRLGERRVVTAKQRFRLMTEIIGGIKDVKLMGLESTYLERFRKPAEELSRVSAKHQTIGQIPRYVMQAVVMGGMLALVLVMLVRSGGDLRPMIPTLGLYAFAGLRIMPHAQVIYAELANIRFGTAALEGLISSFDEARAHQFRRGPVPEPLHLKHQLELADVTFKYPTADKPALHHLTLKIDANTSVGLVGGTGAGKTTVVDIILGLLTPDEGCLKVDGTAIDQAGLPAWQRSVAYVPQHIFLVDETIAVNIAFGTPPDEIDMAMVERAARLAELHDFIMTELADGYETAIGERGIRLSGGQRQRIGIARALYQNPDVLIMDEATSALDNITERSVMDAVANLAGTKTVIMIAHRLSTVLHCDKIIVLKSGRVCAEGTYQQLLDHSPEFRAMVNGEISRTDAA